MFTRFHPPCLRARPGMPPAINVLVTPKNKRFQRLSDGHRSLFSCRVQNKENRLHLNLLGSTQNKIASILYPTQVNSTGTGATKYILLFGHRSGAGQEHAPLRDFLAPLDIGIAGHNERSDALFFSPPLSITQRVRCGGPAPFGIAPNGSLLR